MRAAPRVARHGFTLLELVIALAVAAVLASMGMPSLAGWVQQHRLNAAAYQLQGDVLLGRHEAQRRGQPVHLSFQTGPHWCWALSLQSPVDCRHPDSAAPGQLLKRVGAETHPQVELRSAQAMAWEADSGLGQNAPATALLGLAHGGDGQLAVRLGALGRASLCRPLPAGARAAVPAAAAAPHAAAIPACS